ncbi:hypothetical protein FVR03_17180 [Pontibacter qinzhouensis]|uniref:DUF1049 domain-containing protein n=1 Tax=Pontibacter qinzhouensis TaxID=2603253 RepID=A0A5C8JJA8_9BACT|nr:hypothetical protein [Pontibacter qinzhouensis]TXK36667.1 hypothetical protein FVR03_17180 [Pontibacter qinzhouensis]
MKALKIILDLVVIAYVIVIFLLLTTLLDAAIFFNLSTGAQLQSLYKILLSAGAALLLARLWLGWLIVADKQHHLHKAQLKINELKAELYERRQAYRNKNHQPLEMETWHSAQK